MLVTGGAAKFGLKCVSGQYVTVDIDQGTLRGNTNSTVSGTTYYTFLGIPYAKPPLGELRFATCPVASAIYGFRVPSVLVGAKAPQAADSWTSQRDALQFGSNCRQIRGGSEDCLFVNVFTPKLPNEDDNALLPVLFVIHGGAFIGRSGDLTPGHMMDKGLVIVSINYRLNVYGFLSLEGTNAPGNAGLKDQTLALKWVQANIAKFGGDPDNVTIVGESLFHRAISESGSALNPWAYTPGTQDYAIRLGNRLRYHTEGNQGLLYFLRNATVEAIDKAVPIILTHPEKVRYLSNPFVPSLEYPNPDEEPFLPYPPRYMESQGLFNRVPYITGSNSDEGKAFVGSDASMEESTYWETIVNDLERVVPLDLGLTKGSAESVEVANKVKEFYFGDQELSYDTKQHWIDLQTDLLITLGVQTTVRSHSSYSNSTYNYQFIYNGATHGAEYSYVFYAGSMEDGSTDAVKMATLFADMWSDFAKTGDPSLEEETEWLPVSESSFPYLQINTTLTPLYNLENDRMNFWFDIYNNYYNITSQG
uniref:Carboxylesterase type B domain-containing protein n=1 Tax=Timema bartmani TaxID=61472 RepID=A0A7R9F2G7_9NEOP|nr:unnamed protein product [Timema bartmani]